MRHSDQDRVRPRLVIESELAESLNIFGACVKDERDVNMMEVADETTDTAQVVLVWVRHICITCP